jgi:hypothetical protein
VKIAPGTTRAAIDAAKIERDLGFVPSEELRDRISQGHGVVSLERAWWCAVMDRSEAMF